MNRPDASLGEAIAEMDFVDGNTVHLKHDIDAGLAEVYRIDTLSGIVLSDFTVTFAPGTPNPYGYANTQPAPGNSYG